MIFDPSTIDLDTIGTFDLQKNSLHSVLLILNRYKSTGRLSLLNRFGENHLYFMRGNPVGVFLERLQYPLGELLLEQGMISARNYLEAQRYIVEEKRLPGQVFKEMGLLNEQRLGMILTLQNQRKAESFCRIQDGKFQFAHGLSFLSGFQSTTLYIDSLLFFALRFSMSKINVAEYISKNERHYILLKNDSEWSKTPTSSYGLHPKEESISRKIQRRKRRIGRLFEKCSSAESLILLIEHLKISEQLEIFYENKNAEYQGLKVESLDVGQKKLRSLLADTPEPKPLKPLIESRHLSDHDGTYKTTKPDFLNTSKASAYDSSFTKQASLMVDDSEG